MANASGPFHRGSQLSAAQLTPAALSMAREQSAFIAVARRETGPHLARSMPPLGAVPGTTVFLRRLAAPAAAEVRVSRGRSAEQLLQLRRRLVAPPLERLEAGQQGELQVLVARVL